MKIYKLLFNLTLLFGSSAMLSACGSTGLYTYCAAGYIQGTQFSDCVGMTFSANSSPATASVSFSKGGTFQIQLSKRPEFTYVPTADAAKQAIVTFAKYTGGHNGNPGYSPDEKVTPVGFISSASPAGAGMISQINGTTLTITLTPAQLASLYLSQPSQNRIFYTVELPGNNFAWSDVSTEPQFATRTKTILLGKTFKDTSQNDFSSAISSIESFRQLTIQ